jgi:hypothetical protein
MDVRKLKVTTIQIVTADKYNNYVTLRTVIAVTLVAANELEWTQNTVYIDNNLLLNGSVLLVHINSNCSMYS